MKTYSNRSSYFRRNFVIGVLSCAALAVWTYHGARRKALNLGLLSEVLSRQEDVRYGKQTEPAYAGHAITIEALIQQGADPNVRVGAYPYGSFPSEMRSRFQWDLLRPWYWKYTFRDVFGSHNEGDGGSILI